MNLKTSYSILFYTVFLIAIATIGGIGGVFTFGVSYLFYSIIAYILVRIIQKIRKKNPDTYRDFFKRFSYGLALMLSMVIALLWTFIWYQNDINPAKLPLYTLTNGEKILQFETMSHIASPEFYKQVENNIASAKHDDYVLYYEGVGPGTPENMEAFTQALGVDITPTLYTSLSELYGITAQNNEDFLNIVNNKDYNVDLSIDEVMEIYRASQENGTDTIPSGPPNPLPMIETQLSEFISSLTPGELSLIRAVNQSILNFMIKHGGLRESIVDQLGAQDIFQVILDDRNKHLVETIISSNEQKIFITYGLMHFDGVYELLRDQDPNWEIIQTQEFQVISEDS